MADTPTPTLAKSDMVRQRTEPPARRRSPSLVLSTFQYLMRTDVHTFAFSVAANSIL